MKHVPFDAHHLLSINRNEEVGDLYVVFLFFYPLVVSANEDDIKVRTCNMYATVTCEQCVITHYFDDK